MELNKTIFCPSCGTKNKINASYCLRCGVELVQSDSNSQKNCPKCGGVTNTNSEFCKHCGVNIKLYEPNTTEISEIIVPPHLIIPKCGIILGIIIFFYGFLYLITFRSVSVLIIIFIGLVLIIIFSIVHKFAKKRTIEAKKIIKPNVFSISDVSIKLSLPKVPHFQIYWTQFHKISIIWIENIMKSTLKVDFSSYSSSFRKSIKLKEGVHFYSNNCKYIMDLIIQYSQNKNIEVHKEIKYPKGGGFIPCDCTCATLILIAIGVGLGRSVFDPNILNEKITLNLPVFIIFLIISFFSIISLMVKTNAPIKEDLEFVKHSLILDLPKRAEK